jgi:AcrR family transcriptional regulator
MTERGRATRAKLIEATLSVVRDVGYAHASTRAIADAAGVAEGTIYRHFPDKASLFFAAALESGTAAMDWVPGLPGRAGQFTVEENLLDVLHRLAALQQRMVPLELAILADPELAAQRQRIVTAGGPLPGGPPEAIAAYLAAEQELGRVRADVQPREVAVVLLAVLFGLAVAPSTAPGAIDRGRIAAAVDVIVRGIAPLAP